MKIIQRYVLQELWAPFILCLVTLNFIFMGGYLVRAASFIIGRGVPFIDTMYVLILALPEMVSYTVPTSLLTAVLIVFGNFSQNNEIRAMKASGLHPFLVMTPAFLLGLGFSFAMFVFNDNVATNAGFLLRKTTKQMLIKHPMAMIEPGRFVNLNDSIIFHAKEVDGNKIRDVVAIENEGDDKPVRTIIAESGEIVTSEDQTRIQIKLYDGSVSDSSDQSVQAIQFQTYEFPSLGQDDIRQMKKKTRDLSLAELLFKLPFQDNDRDKKELWSAFHQRIAFSFGCFVFVFIGIPAAIIVHRGEIVLSFAISMGCASLYYVLFVGAKTIAVEGYLPPVVAFWIPNVLLFGLGLFLLRKSYVS